VPLTMEAISTGDGSCNASGSASLALGRIKWFSIFKGFGFIEPLHEDAEGREVFVHKNQLLEEETDIRSLKPGAEVAYALGETEDGRTCAVHVRVVDRRDSIERQSGDGAQTVSGTAEGVAENAEEFDAAEEDTESSSASSVDIDLVEELHSGVYQVKGEAKDQCEDFVVDKVKIPISVLGETATCVFFGVFDGHGGGSCAEYAATHLAKNVLARLRDRTKTANDELALRTALLGGFKQTEHNFLQHARRAGDTSGSTACTMTVFGPDEEMRLRLFLANVGDSRAVLGKATGEFLRLTEDHKPNLPLEKKRIELEGGSVVEVAGVWRCVLPQKRRVSGIIGLAVSRSLGDKDFKGPNIVNPDPDITIHEIDWDADEFVILATDGIWDVISDKDAVRLVQRCLQQFGNEEKAAEELVHRARDRGSKDDCTALIVRFGWLKVERGGGCVDEHASDHEREEGSSQTSALGERVEDPTASTKEAKKEHEGQAEEKDEHADKDVDRDVDEDEDEHQDEDESEEAEEELPLVSVHGAMCASDTAADGSDDDIFAELSAAEQNGAQPQEENQVLPQLRSLTTPDADGPGLFDGLGPTQEELAVMAGPALPPADEGTKGVVEEGGIVAAAADGGVDMFGA